MQSFFDWIRAASLVDRPWLLLGKGPTFARRHDLDLTGWRTFGLNHVCREMTVDVAHAIDLDVIDGLGEPLLRRAGVVVMPWFPHVPDDRRPAWFPRRAIRVSTRPLDAIADEHPVLRRLAEEGRLLWYNLATAASPRAGSPVVPVKAFSSVAALNLLGMAGVRTVRSLGIDGGGAYSAEFADLDAVTRLMGGQPSYDIQFGGLANAIMTTGVSFAAIGADTPIRVFVGATPAQDLAVRVLEFSIRRRTPMDVTVVPLHATGLTIPEARDPRNRSRTPFSFQRFLIPEAAGFRGRAFYLDSDMLVLDDLRQLWAQPFGDANVLGVRTERTDATARFSVLLLDCAALDWKIDEIVRGLDEGRYTYAQLLYEMNWGPRVANAIDARWNSLDSFRDGHTALLHYTDVHRQPWVSTEHPFGYLWMRELFEALDAGVIGMPAIEAAAAAGHVRPSLLTQVRERIEDPLLLPARARRQDLFFVEPFRVRAWTGASPLARAALVARAAGRRTWRRSRAFRLQQWLRQRW